MVVNGFRLVWERIDLGNRQGEVEVVFEGELEAHGLDAETEYLGSPSKGSMSGLVSSRAKLSGLRTASKTLLIWRPLPTSFTPDPIGMVTMTCTGSGKSGPRRILPGFRSCNFTRRRPRQRPSPKLYANSTLTARKKPRGTAPRGNWDTAPGARQKPRVFHCLMKSQRARWDFMEGRRVHFVLHPGLRPACAPPRRVLLSFCLAAPLGARKCCAPRGKVEFGGSGRLRRSAPRARVFALLLRSGKWVQKGDRQN